MNVSSALNFRAIVDDHLFVLSYCGFMPCRLRAGQATTLLLLDMISPVVISLFALSFPFSSFIRCIWIIWWDMGQDWVWDNSYASVLFGSVAGSSVPGLLIPIIPILWILLLLFFLLGLFLLPFFLLCLTCHYTFTW